MFVPIGLLFIFVFACIHVPVGTAQFNASNRFNMNVGCTTFVSVGAMIIVLELMWYVIWPYQHFFYSSYMRVFCWWIVHLAYTILILASIMSLFTTIALVDATAGEDFIPSVSPDQ